MNNDTDPASTPFPHFMTPQRPGRGPAEDGTGAIVVGGGPAGLASALGLAQAGIETTLITPNPPLAGTGTHARTAALFAPSLAMLERLGAAQACQAASTPLAAIRLIDDTERFLRAPEVLFEARELGLPCFGRNIPNGAIEDALRAQIAIEPGPIQVLDGTKVVELSADGTGVSVRLDDGRQLRGAVVVAADGRRSVCRDSAGITATSRDYPQVAVTTTFTHARDHGGISTEFHRAAGPCTVVPLPGRRSALVWVERPAIAQRLLGLDDTAFIAALEDRLKGLLGAIGSVTARASFPLTLVQASAVAANRVLLVGEAAHVMPPIGAQGLNLGLRDAAAAVECLSEAFAQGRDLGGAETLGAYTAARSADIRARMTAVDSLNRVLLSDLLPVHFARGLGLHILSASAALRKRAMAEGMQPSGTLPRLMRPVVEASTLDAPQAPLA